MTEQEVRELAERFINEFQGSSGMRQFHGLNDEEFDPYCDFDSRANNEQLFWDIVENQIFNCTQCGWWCETGDMADNDGEWICNDCHAENQND